MGQTITDLIGSEERVRFRQVTPTYGFIRQVPIMKSTRYKDQRISVLTQRVGTKQNQLAGIDNCDRSVAIQISFRLGPCANDLERIC